MFTSAPASMLLAFTPADDDARDCTATVFSPLLDTITARFGRHSSAA